MYLLILVIWGVVFVVMRVHDTRLQAKPANEIQALTWRYRRIRRPACCTFPIVNAPRRLFCNFFLTISLLVLFRLALRGWLCTLPARQPPRRVRVGGWHGTTGAAGDAGRASAAGGFGVGRVRCGKYARLAAVRRLYTGRDVPALVKQRRVDEVIFALPLRSHGVPKRWLRRCKAGLAKIRVVPDYLDLVMSRGHGAGFQRLADGGFKKRANDYQL